MLTMDYLKNLSQVMNSPLSTELKFFHSKIHNDIDNALDNISTPVNYN